MELNANKKKQKNYRNNLWLTNPPKNIPKDVLNIIPIEVAQEHQMVVFEKNGKTAKVAVVDSNNIDALNALRFLSENENLEFEIYSVSPENFKKIIEQYSGTKEAVDDVVRFFKEENKFHPGAIRNKKKSLVADDIIQDAPVTKLVKVIIDHALDGRASDIHIEPTGNEYRVRFRVDGILHPSLILPKNIGLAVVSHIKILASLKIDEKRKPQDGRFNMKHERGDVDFRVSTFPVIEGEKLVMRVLTKDDEIFKLDKLGLIGRNKEILIKKIKDPYGIILMTGPTGSGKSTTLYAFLKILNGDDINIVTLEDPVEYFVEGINQSQVKPEIGYTFSSGLRSILRQDPNVIMVGEIRDSETAELAIHAALTGHIVFSTLHTNSAIGAVPRLMDMGVEPFLLTSSLKVLAAQRLVRKICDHCKYEEEIPGTMLEKIKKEIENIPKEEIKKYGIDISRGLHFFRGKGCEECGGLGFKGRVAIYEVVEIDNDMQKIITEKEGNEAAIWENAIKQGMITIKQDGILKALKGYTSLSEIERITEGSMSVGGDMTDDKG